MKQRQRRRAQAEAVRASIDQSLLDLSNKAEWAKLTLARLQLDSATDEAQSTDTAQKAQPPPASRPKR